MLQKDFNNIGNHTEEYQLSVVLMADSFFYGVFDPNCKLIAHRSYKNIFFSDTSVAAILEDVALSYTYRTINVVALGGNSHQLTFPDDSFIQSLPMLAWKELYQEQLPGQSIYNYFGITPAQRELLQKLFKDQTYQIHDTIYLLTTYYIGHDQAKVHLHFEENLVSIYIQSEDKVQFFNTFKFVTDKDVLYFVLAAIDYAHLDPKTHQVNVTGWIDQKSAIFTILQSYLKNIEILKDPEFDISTTESYNASHYFIHFVNRLCGS
jgi:hypothetical protein